MVVRCTGACLDSKQGWHPHNLTLVDLQIFIGLLAPLKLPFSAPRDLAHMCKYETLNITCHGVQRAL
jgi:hypothetical protein